VQLEQMYQEIILDHYRTPHGSGLREPFDAESFQVNPTCGDEIRLRVKLDGEKVAEVSHETLGCSISQASASVLTDLVSGAASRTRCGCWPRSRRWRRAADRCSLMRTSSATAWLSPAWPGTRPG